MLLAVEVVADKVPVVDHVNDVVQTVVRPTAGGLAFGAGSSSETVTVTDPGAFFGSHQWVPIAAGVVIALGVHGVKAASRPVVNATTAGVGAPVASTAEDFSSVVLSLLAILLPVLVLVGSGAVDLRRGLGDPAPPADDAGIGSRLRVPTEPVCLVDCFRARHRRTRLRPDLVAGLLSRRP